MLLKREERNFQKKFVVQISTRQGQNVYSLFGRNMDAATVPS